MSKRPYYILAMRSDVASPWGIEFGDYDKSAVDFERDDYRDHDHRATNLKIIKLADARRNTSSAAIDKLNQGVNQ